MEPQSPPKRMTRARAAAKASSDAAATTTAASRAKASTAASKARSMRAASSTATATTASVAAKRKLRSEDIDDNDTDDELSLDRPAPAMAKTATTTARPTARGRPRKVPTTTTADHEPAEAPRPRGRPPKKATTAAATEAMSRATGPTRATRAKKATAAEEDAAAAGEAPAKKKTARSRATSSAAPTISVRTATSSVPASAAASKPTTKKKVTFEEPEKENIIPRTAAAKGKTAASAIPTATSKTPATTAAGLRAKPARRAGATAAATKTTAATTTAGRAARTASMSRKTASSTSTAGAKTADQAVSERVPTPLSPKKVTQVRMARDTDVESEDELCSMDNIKPFMRSPTKPAMASVGAQGLAKKSMSGSSADASSASLPAPDMATGMLASPARRPPPSPLKESLKASPAKRLDGAAAVDVSAASASHAPIASKPSLLFSPAKRFPAPVRTSTFGGGLDDTTRSPFKLSMLQTPAKRPASPVKAAFILGRPEFKLPTAKTEPVVSEEPTEMVLKETELQEAMSPQPKSTLLATPLPEPIAEGEDENEDEGNETADHEDDNDTKDDASGEVTTTLQKLLEEMAADAAEGLADDDSPSRKRFPGRMSDVLPRIAHPAEVAEPVLSAVDEGNSIVEEEVMFAEQQVVVAYEAVISAGEPMDLDHQLAQDDVLEDALKDAGNELPVSPPKQQQMAAPTGIFGLRTKDLVACDIDSDSDDDMTTCFSSSDDALSPFGTVPASPCPANMGHAKVQTPGCRKSRQSLSGQGSTAKRLRMGKFGFTPLADKLSGWKASSPTKKDASPMASKKQQKPSASPVEVAEPSPVTAFFDEAISGHSTPVSPAKGVSCEPEADCETVQEEQLEQPAHEDSNDANDTEAIDNIENVESVDNVENIFDAFDSDMFEHSEVQMPEFDELPVTEEDLDLAQEAHEMSLMEPERLDNMLNLTPSQDDALSEASQEYGDENAIPIDPALLAPPNASSPGVPPVTPQRAVTHTFHTVSKVPLKPADESTPRSPVRRHSLSASRLPMSSRRASFGTSALGSNSKMAADDTTTSSTSSSCSLTRNATVISYSPSKKDSRRESRDSRRESRRSSSRRASRRESFGGALLAADMTFDNDSDQEELSLYDDSIPDVVVEPASPTRSPPVTPAKSENGGSWSTSVTPARTPRRDLDPALLRGAVVFVDVHTTEGADASGIFVELLTQMGARCVKNWSWSPFSSPSDKNTASPNGSSSKIGITHVVYKDGGKRTLEKVRESGGVVQCVGVSWVLDCERENQWLDEAPYYIDTSMVPRGGARRRKSMEPRSLSNQNGKIVSTPAKQTLSPSHGRECHTAPAPAPRTPTNRRDSALWVRTPEEDKEDNGGSVSGEDGDAYGEPDWDMSGMLTPVPKTPAPEAIARYAAGISPSTPMGGGYMDDSTLSSIQYEEDAENLMTRTCPPKSTYHYHELGAGILSREKDERVLMRLMAARRKSLQFAPKVASPLSRAWN